MHCAPPQVAVRVEGISHEERFMRRADYMKSGEMNGLGEMGEMTSQYLSEMAR
jgi:hypothetical protein